MSLLPDYRRENQLPDQQEFIAGYDATVEQATNAAEQIIRQFEPAIVQERIEAERRQHAGRVGLMPAQPTPVVAEMPTVTQQPAADGSLDVESIRRNVLNLTTSSAVHGAAAFPQELMTGYRDEAAA